MFGTAHNSFMSCCELFFLPNTCLQNSFMDEAVFLLSQKHEWDEAEKSSLLQLSLISFSHLCKK